MDVYAIVGGGGFGREVAPVAQEMLMRQGKHEAQLCFLVEGAESGQHINGIPVLNEQEFFALEATQRLFNIAIADSKVRQRIAESLIGQGAKPFSIIAQQSALLAENEIAEGALLCPYSTVTSNARIGKFFHSNIYSYVAHDCIIGDYVTFAPRVSCNGNVIVEDHAYIGTGAVIRQGSKDKPLTIGTGAIIGMGAVVTKDVPPHALVVGNPARPMEKK